MIKLEHPGKYNKVKNKYIVVEIVYKIRKL